MSDLDGLDRGEAETNAPRADLAAVLHRIGASLDPEAVLREVIEGARALTGARLAAIATVISSSAVASFPSGHVDRLSL